MHDMDANTLIRLFSNPEDALKLSLKEWQLVVLALRHQQLLARYAIRFKDFQVFESLHNYVKHHLINAEIVAEKQTLQVLFEARQLSKQLTKYNAQFIFLKGAGYSLSGHPVGAGRTYSDIDVLTAKEHIENIEKDLTLHGWLPEKMTDYDQKYYRTWAHEIPPMKHAERGTVLDIHHNIVPPVSNRAPDSSVFFNNVELSESGHWTFTKEAMTLHSLVHLFFNEDFKYGFRDLLDLHILMTTNADNTYWSKLVAMAKTSGFTGELYLACRYTQKILNTPVPIEVYRELKPYRSWTMPVLDYIFLRLLSPNHPFFALPGYKLAAFLGFIRGHKLKMPFHILFFHTITKGGKLILEALFGSSLFAKNEITRPK